MVQVSGSGKAMGTGRGRLSNLRQHCSALGGLEAVMPWRGWGLGWGAKDQPFGKGWLTLDISGIDRLV